MFKEKTMRNYSLLFIVLAFSILVFSSLYSFVNGDEKLFHAGIFTFGILVSFGALTTALLSPSEKEELERQNQLDDLYRHIDNVSKASNDDLVTTERWVGNELERVENRIEALKPARKKA
jgi:hypothetical protein